MKIHNVSFKREEDRYTATVIAFDHGKDYTEEAVATKPEEAAAKAIRKVMERRCEELIASVSVTTTVLINPDA